MVKGRQRGLKNKLSVVASRSINLAEFGSIAEAKEHEISIPLTVPGGNVECSPSLFYISLRFLELRIDRESSNIVQRSTVTPSPLLEESIPIVKGEDSAIKAGLRKVKTLTRSVSTQRAKKAGHGEEGSDGTSSVSAIMHYIQARLVKCDIDYGEEGGDDIDFDRRQLNSSAEAIYAQCNLDEGPNVHQPSVSEFGDDNFVVGHWEKIAVISRSRWAPESSNPSLVCINSSKERKCMHSFSCSYC